MPKAIRVRYENGVLKPLEPLDPSEGEELVIVLQSRSFYKLASEMTFEAKQSVDEVLGEIRKRGKRLHEP